MITLYDHPLSPYAQKVKISLREKGLEFKTEMPGGLGAGGASPADLAATAFAPQIAGAFVLAAVIAFAAPQSWDWTRRLTPERVAIALALFVVALLAMEYQPYNPFIYFIF